ncbi:MAG: hypothetical protein SFU98_09570 [Leptospiraceae bacterium]|nr:hypothetical protein [Leptospiraceae bacterium]
MKNFLKHEITEICKTWCENPNQFDLEISHNMNQPDLVFRYLDYEPNKEDWYIIELSCFEKLVSLDDIILFISKIPIDRKVKEIVIVSRVGFIPNAKNIYPILHRDIIFSGLLQ